MLPPAPVIRITSSDDAKSFGDVVLLADEAWEWPLLFAVTGLRVCRLRMSAG
jgi:hypothetical protein